jgi:hypothetical protein
MFTNDPIEIGIIALPNDASQFFFGGFMCIIMGKIGHLKGQIVTGLVLQLLFTALYSTILLTNKAAFPVLRQRPLRLDHAGLVRHRQSTRYRLRPNRHLPQRLRRQRRFQHHPERRRIH